MARAVQSACTAAAAPLTRTVRSTADTQAHAVPASYTRYCVLLCCCTASCHDGKSLPCSLLHEPAASEGNNAYEN